MRFIVALTGASGQILGIRLIEKLVEHGEVYVIASRAALLTLSMETEFDEEFLKSISTEYFGEDDLSAPIASGSFEVDGMAIVPCTIKTASSIAYGITGNLISRAADVCLKEGRRLVVAVREAPLHLGHLKMLARLAEIGAVVFPPVMSFYTRPKSIEDMVDYTASRIAELLGARVEYRRWEGGKKV